MNIPLICNVCGVTDSFLAPELAGTPCRRFHAASPMAEHFHCTGTMQTPPLPVRPATLGELKAQLAARKRLLAIARKRSALRIAIADHDTMLRDLARYEAIDQGE